MAQARKWTDKELRQIRRRVENGTSVRSLADELGISRPRLYQLLKGRWNPEGRERHLKCARCGHGWRTHAIDRPERCPGCRTIGVYWQQPKEGAEA